MTVKKKIILEVDTKKGQQNVKKLDKDIKNTDKSSKATTGGMKGMTMATKGFGLALKSAGIGLILAALVKLGQVFQGNMRVAREFEKIGTKLGVMFDVLRDTIEPVADFLVSMFEDPLGGLLELGEMIVQNILNRFMAVMTLGKGVAKVLEGVFTLNFDKVTEGVVGMTQATVQFSTGLDPQQQENFANSLMSMGEEMVKETSIADKLAEALFNVRDREMEMTGIRAKANKIIAQSRLLAEDDTKSMEERLKALKDAVAEEKRVAAIEMEIQKDKVDAMQGMIDLGKSSEEDLKELAEERAKLTDLETASILKQKRVAAEIGTFTSQIAKKNAQLEKDRLDRIDLNLKAQAHKLEITEEMSNKEVAAMIKQAETEQKLSDKALADLKKALMSKEELEIKAQQDKYDKLLADAQLYGYNTELLTEQHNLKLKEIQDKYDQEEIDKQQKVEDEKFALANKRIDQAQQIMGTLAQIAQEELNAEKNALKEQLDQGLISQEEFDKESAKIEKESVKREKKNAMLQILIDTAQGVAGAIKAGAGLVFPANLGAIIAGVTSVLSGIASAKAILNKVPGGGGGGGDDSVNLDESSSNAPNTQGIGNLIPNNFGNNQQPVQAFVVENDISNAQALQEELDVQATL